MLYESAIQARDDALTVGTRAPFLPVWPGIGSATRTPRVVAVHGIHSKHLAHSTSRFTTSPSSARLT